MDPSAIKILIRETFPILNNWTKRFLDNDTTANPIQFLDENQKPLYNLVMVGGVALNSSIRRQYPTRDLD